MNKRPSLVTACVCVLGKENACMIDNTCSSMNILLSKDVENVWKLRVITDSI